MTKLCLLVTLTYDLAAINNMHVDKHFLQFAYSGFTYMQRLTETKSLTKITLLKYAYIKFLFLLTIGHVEFNITSLSSTDRLVSFTCWKWGEALFILLSLCNSQHNLQNTAHRESKSLKEDFGILFVLNIYVFDVYFSALHISLSKHLRLLTKHLPRSASSPARSGTRHKYNPQSQRNYVNRQSWKYRFMQPKVTKALINHATTAGVDSFFNWHCSLS